MAATEYAKALSSVLMAGTLWSFGALIVRYMVDAYHYRWQYLFFRGVAIALVLCLYLAFKDGNRLIVHFRNIGFSGVIGASGLVCAFVCYIWSITLTTAANTLIMIAISPFVAALLGLILLKEKIRSVTWISITMSLIGISVMVMENLETGAFWGTIIGFGSAFGFAVFSVSIRFRKDAPQFANIALAGMMCTLLTIAILYGRQETILMPIRNVFLSMLHGLWVAGGLILFSQGAKQFTAAELNLLSLTEVIGGVVWVYLPIFGIHEIPSIYTVVGGSIVLGAIFLNSTKGFRAHQVKG
ncbi:conserved membrane hypothetical protein [Desulfamplus magnetovallimortis]|uniref:EamA domain-containing protein n=1 Tax=Desulfamplus magnetovallimortis TaxID=1246637 RepID=A0A1W1HEK1_9BACT|nr:DMT family transporter [Desulfamplus magnetovallimortis]SLM30931.1 conserved membrane hypothetical protein [Desulfamplus magnetovallimortis]